MTKAEDGIGPADEAFFNGAVTVEDESDEGAATMERGWFEPVASNEAAQGFEQAPVAEDLPDDDPGPRTKVRLTGADIERAARSFVPRVTGYDGHLTPYKIHTLLNQVYNELGIEREIRPQMMYNYRRLGMIVPGDNAKRNYTPDEAVAFVLRYVSKHH